MAGYIGSKASVVSSGAERKKVFDITATTTSLTGCSYTPNQVHVFHNGVRLVDGTDYTATDGSTVTLTTAAQSGDEVVVISYATFQTSDTVSASAGGTFSNAVTIDANGATVLTVDRATSDGTIIDLQKDGSSVGSVGAATASGVTSIYAGNDDTALWFRNGIDAVTPFSISGNTTRDAAINIGQSGGRFKDLYLSGSISDGTNSATVAQIVSGGGAGSIVAFVNFNGTNNSIRNSGNVSSITDHGTGQYTINFSSALSTANYSWSYGVSDGGSASNPRTMNPTDTSTKSTTAFRTAWQDQANNTNDPTYACVNFIT